MLAETGILERDQAAADRQRAATRSSASSISTALRLYRRGRGSVLPGRGASCKAALGADIAGRLHTGALAQRHRPHAVQAGAEASASTRCSPAAARLLDGADRRSPSARRRRSSSPTPTASRRSRRPSAIISAPLIEVLLRDVERLVAGARASSTSPDGRGRDHHHRLPARPRARRASCSASPRRCENSYGCIAAVDYMTARLRALKLMFLHLGRFDPGPAVLDRLRGRPALRARTASCRSPRSCRRSATRCRSSICASSPR